MSVAFNEVLKLWQMNALLAELDTPRPQIWTDFTEAISALSLDVTLIIGRAALPTVTFRVLFLIVAVLLPLVLNLFLLLLARPWYVVLWYFLVVGSSVAIVVGILGTALPAASVTNETAGKNIAIVGGAVLGAMLLIFLVKLLWEKHKKNSEEEEDSGDDDEEEELEEMTTQQKMARDIKKQLDSTEEVKSEALKTERELRDHELKFHRKRTCIHFCVTLCLIMAGLILAGWIPLQIAALTGTRSKTANIIGYVIFSFGVISFIYGVMWTFQSGREAAVKLDNFVKDNLLRVLIIATLFSFIPVVSYCVDSFLCTDYACPPGTLFNPHATRDVGSYSKAESVFCDACAFDKFPSNNATCKTLACPGFEGRRLFSDPQARCDDESYAYLVIAAGIIFIAYIFGIPSSFYFMTSTLTDLIPLEAKIVEVTEANHPEMEEDEREELNWQKQQAAVPAVAGSMYSPYSRKMRFYALFDLLQRFLFVLILNVIAPFSSAASTILVLVAHVLFTTCLLIFRPYCEFALQFFAVLLSSCSVLNATLVVSLWATGDGEALSAYAYTVIAINVAISAVGGAILVVLEFRAMGNKEASFKEEAQEQEDNMVKQLEETTTAPDFDAEDREDMIQKARDLVEAHERHNLIVQLSTNHSAMDLLSQQFMILGVILGVAFFFTALSVLREPASEFHVGSSSIYTNIDETLAGYQSWQNFTDSCCCTKATTSNFDYNVTERWLCRNGHSVLRGRRSADLKTDGLPLRGFCNSTFRPGCTLYVSDNNNVASVVCSEAVKKSLLADPTKEVSELSFSFYW